MFWFHFQTYVQNILKQNSNSVFRCIVKEGGHFYVCGDVKMASDVTAILESILASEGNMTIQDAKNFVLKLRVSKKKNGISNIDTNCRYTDKKGRLFLAVCVDLKQL